MNPEKLARYEHLYGSARYMGAGALLRSYLGLPPDAPLPLSVSHGVDFGHCHAPMDIDAIEPIHWSCNPTLHEEARRIKPSILAPHPWALVTRDRPANPGRGVLVIGPPPSPENDARLHALIESDVGDDWSILIKARGNYGGSFEFWKSKGLKPISAHGPDDTFYLRLHEILAAHHTIVGCTFSSALIFGASIAREIVVLKDYFYEVYEPVRYEEEVDFASPRARAFVQCVVDGDPKEKTEQCRALLGVDLLDQQDRIRRDLESAIRGLRRPFHQNRRNPLPYPLTEAVAMFLGKQGVLRYSPHDVVDLLRPRAICTVRMNDVDIWLSGKSVRNFQQLPPAPRETARPGFSPRGYAT